MHIDAKRGRVAVWAGSSVIALAGLAVAGVSLSWLMASFGLSGIAAAQAVTAIEIGGAALAVIAAMFSGGVLGAVVSTITWYLKRKLRTLAIR